MTKRSYIRKLATYLEKHYGYEIQEEFYKLCLSKTGNKINYFESKVGYSKLALKWKLMVPIERSMPKGEYNIHQFGQNQPNNADR